MLKIIKNMLTINRNKNNQDKPAVLHTDCMGSNITGVLTQLHEFLSLVMIVNDDLF